MSMPFVEYTCTDCDFRDADHVVWGIFYYRTPTGDVDLKRALGWCDDCARLVPIEVLPSAEHLEMYRARIDECRQRLDSLSLQEAASRPLWKRLLRLKSWSYDRMILQQQLDDLKSHNADLKALALQLTTRLSGRRCLACSSESVHQVPQPSMPSEYDSADPYEVIAVEMRHPGCGGQLMARNSEFRLNMQLQKRIYDLEGRLLETAACD